MCKYDNIVSVVIAVVIACEFPENPYKKAAFSSHESFLFQLNGYGYIYICATPLRTRLIQGPLPIYFFWCLLIFCCVLLCQDRWEKVCSFHEEKQGRKTHPQKNMAHVLLRQRHFRKRRVLSRIKTNFLRTKRD